MRFGRYSSVVRMSPVRRPRHLIVLALWAPSCDFSAALRGLFFLPAIAAAGRMEYGSAHFPRRFWAQGFNRL